MIKLPANFLLPFAGVLLVGLMAGAVQGTTIVQMTINGQLNGVLGPLNNYQIQLYDSQAPITVTNFLRYVNNDNYDNTIVHRSVSDFVIQGGGYTPQAGSSNEILALNPIVNYGAIQNEFSSNRSNVRGTVAMARVGGQVNSATNQWFINISNDNTFLDNVDGGFTVFGRVVGEGMKIADAINNTPTYDLDYYLGLGSAFTEVPLYEPYDDVSLLVTITNASVIPTSEWKGGNGSGPTNWGLSANWTSGAVPGGAGTNLIFGTQTSGNSVVDMVSSARTVGNIYYAPNTSTTIQSTGHYNLTLNNNTDPAKVSVLGNHTISAPVILSSDAVFTGDGTLTLSGGISGAYDIAVIGGNIVAKNIRVNNLILDAGRKITIQPMSGGPLSGSLQPIPEPSALALLGAGVFSLLAYGWLRKHN